jgi:hypothetical protein
MSTIPPEISFKLMSLVVNYGLLNLAYRVARLICAHDEPIALNLKTEKDRSATHLNTPIEPGKQSGGDGSVWRSMARLIWSKIILHV